MIERKAIQFAIDQYYPFSNGVEIGQVGVVKSNRLYGSNRDWDYILAVITKPDLDPQVLKIRVFPSLQILEQEAAQWREEKVMRRMPFTVVQTHMLEHFVNSFLLSYKSQE